MRCVALRYVEFGGLKIESDGTATAAVLSRRGIAAALGVPEAMLVEWACFSGNDYTKPLVSSAKSDGLFRLVAVDDAKLRRACPEGAHNERERAEEQPSISEALVGVPRPVDHKDMRTLVRRARVELIALRREVYSIQGRVDAVQQRTAALATRYGIRAESSVHEVTAPEPPSRVAVELQLDLSRQHTGSIANLLKCAIDIVDDGVNWKTNKPLGGASLSEWCQVCLHSVLCVPA